MTVNVSKLMRQSFLQLCCHLLCGSHVLSRARQLVACCLRLRLAERPSSCDTTQAGPVSVLLKLGHPLGFSNCKPTVKCLAIGQSSAGREATQILQALVFEESAQKGD